MAFTVASGRTRPAKTLLIAWRNPIKLVGNMSPNGAILLFFREETTVTLRTYWALCHVDGLVNSMDKRLCASLP